MTILPKSHSILAAILLALAVYILAPGSLRAEAASGFGLFLSSSSLVTTDATAEGGTEQEYAEATYGGGIDYQWALSESFSLGLALSESAGDATFPTLPEVTFHKVSSLEVEARYWMNAFFVGVHRGAFFISTAEGFGSPETSDGTTGGGFSLGLEGDGGWFLVAQSVEIEDAQVPEGPRVDVEGYLLRFGYRWR